MNRREIEKVVFGTLAYYMERDWKLFCKEKQNEIKKSNYRLLKVVGQMKGGEIVDKIKAVTTAFSQKGFHPFLSIVRSCKGVPMRTKQGLEITLFQYSIDGGMEGEVYIEIKEGRWINFSFQRR